MDVNGVRHRFFSGEQDSTAKKFEVENAYERLVYLWQMSFWPAGNRDPNFCSKPIKDVA